MGLLFANGVSLLPSLSDRPWPAGQSEQVGCARILCAARRTFHDRPGGHTMNGPIAATWTDPHRAYTHKTGPHGDRRIARRGRRDRHRHHSDRGVRMTQLLRDCINTSAGIYRAGPAPASYPV